MVRIAEGSARFGTREVRVESAALHESGLRVLRLEVGDESDDVPPLRPGEGLSAASSAALAAWRTRLGTPGALPNIYVPAARRLSAPGGDSLFAGARVDAASRHYLTAAPDARALRIRARVLQWLALRSVIDCDRPVSWTSIACGPAYPMIGALAAARDLGIDARATFVDTCSDALDASRRVALAHGLDVARHRFALGDPAGGGLEPALEPGSQDLVSALWLVDSLDREAAVGAIARAYTLVRPGGSLVISALLDGRAATEPEGRLGWPAATGTGLGALATLVERAGIDVADALACVPQDGAYAVVELARL